MNITTELEACEGYKKLKAAVDSDCEGDRKRGRPLFHDYPAKMAWVLERAKHYAEKTGMDAADILDAWEKERRYWYMNYYQDCNQPKIESDGVRVFDTKQDLWNSVGDAGFRCPLCEGISKDPYECRSGKIVEKIKDGRDGPCNWKVYGLLGDLGKGVYVFVKKEMRGQRIFKPVAWEAAAAGTEAAKKP